MHRQDAEVDPAMGGQSLDDIFERERARVAEKRKLAQLLLEFLKLILRFQSRRSKGRVLWALRS